MEGGVSYLLLSLKQELENISPSIYIGEITNCRPEFPQAKFLPRRGSVSEILVYAAKEAVSHMFKNESAGNVML